MTEVAGDSTSSKGAPEKEGVDKGPNAKWGVIAKIGVSYSRFGRVVLIYYLLLDLILTTIFVTSIRLPFIVIPGYSAFLLAMVITGVAYITISLLIANNFKNLINGIAQGVRSGHQIPTKTSETLIDNFDVDLIRMIREQQGGEPAAISLWSVALLTSSQSGDSLNIWASFKR